MELSNFIQTLPENGVGRYGYYTQNGDRISYNFTDNIIYYRIKIFYLLTGIKLVDFF